MSRRIEHPGISCHDTGGERGEGVVIQEISMSKLALAAF